METFTETKIINLNSNIAIQNNSTYLSSVYFQYNGLLTDSDDIIEKYISIQNAQIPFSFYNINVYNNILKIQIGITVYTLTLTRGNYNANSLITEIKNQLAINLITDITITISSTTGLLTFTKGTGNFTLISNGSTIFKVLGFVVGNDYTSISQNLIAPYPLNLLGTLRLRICSYEFATNNIDFSLITIPIEVGNFGLIQYTNVTNLKASLNNITLDGFDIQILDDDNNFVNFNNISWTMTLALTLIRKKPIVSKTKFNEIIKQTIETNNDTEANIEEIPEENNIEENEEPITEPIEEPITEPIAEPIEEPITDDLDLLLYQNHGNIIN